MADSQKPSVLKRLNDKLGLKLNLPVLLLMFKYVVQGQISRPDGEILSSKHGIPSPMPARLLRFV
jgi:hypothetical protein